MPDKITITNVHPSYDGEYEIDTGTFTNRELHTIKRISGGSMWSALDEIDTDTILAIAVIALQRNGVQVIEDVLWDAEAGNIRFTAEEEKPVPPAVEPPTPDDKSVSGSSASTSEPGSTNGSASLENVRSPTGTPPSDTPATSPSATSAN